MIETYVVHITKKCNMSCYYCYDRDKSSEYSIEEINRNIDSIFKDIGQHKVHIEFLGGEPLLRFDILKDVYKYIENNYSDNVVSYNITTNGTLISKDVINFLKLNENIEVSISFDGTKFSNQLRIFKENYCNSHDVVVKKINMLLKSDIKFAVHMVTHPYNVGYLFDSIVYLYSLGVRFIGIGTVESSIKINKEYCEEFKKQIMEVAFFVKNNKDLSIDLFKNLKPYSDIRTYVKDKISKKTLFESYGRINNKVFDDKEKYDIVKCTEKDKIYEMIYGIRKFAFDFYQTIGKEGGDMSLIGGSTDSINDNGTIKDCVGLIGEHCSYVTNPLDGKMHRDIVVDRREDFEKLLTDSTEKNKTTCEETTNDNDSVFKNIEAIADSMQIVLKRIEKIKEKLG